MKEVGYGYGLQNKELISVNTVEWDIQSCQKESMPFGCVLQDLICYILEAHAQSPRKY